MRSPSARRGHAHGDRRSAPRAAAALAGVRPPRRIRLCRRRAGRPLAPRARPLIHHVGSPFELGLRRQDLEPWWLRAAQDRDRRAALRRHPRRGARDVSVLGAAASGRARESSCACRPTSCSVSRATRPDNDGILATFDLDPAGVSAAGGHGVPPAPAGLPCRRPCPPCARRSSSTRGRSDHPAQEHSARPSGPSGWCRRHGGARGRSSQIATRVSEAVTA